MNMTSNLLLNDLSAFQLPLSFVIPVLGPLSLETVNLQAMISHKNKSIFENHSR